MEYKFNNLHKILKDRTSPEKTKQILKDCKVATKYDKILKNGTPEQQYELANCITYDVNRFKLQPVMLALPLYYAAANKGHVGSQMNMSLYLEYDNHPDNMKYLKMAMRENIDSGAYVKFFINYVRKNKEYLKEPELFKKILKHYKKSKNEEILSHVAVYYEDNIHDYKKALQYYKKTILTGEVERLKMFMKYEANPTKEGREKLANKYPNAYEIAGNKLKPYHYI